MKISFTTNLRRLQQIIAQYDEQSNIQKKHYLQHLKKSVLPYAPSLERYSNTLLFICAHPPDPKIHSLAISELERVARFLKSMDLVKIRKWQNSGMPHTCIVSNFSIDLVSWMIENDLPVQLEDYDPNGTEFKSILKLTLPDIEKEVTAVEDENEALIELLRVKNKQLLPFLLSEFKRVTDQPLIKDYLFDALNLTFAIQLKNPNWSKSFNQLSFATVFYHDKIIKKFDHLNLMNSLVSNHTVLLQDQKKELIRVIKIKLMVLLRETEPVTYMDEESLCYYELERGISIALFTMVPERQLPLESYVGYTLFRNGYPAAYGGAWILGKRALFGINIFDWFRGGESGYILCQLLRIYRQLFNIDYYEVEPYQYGLDNPEGIESGAFWFYYRFGFRPLDKSLNRLAKTEFSKISTNKKYRSKSKTLERFTESNIALQLGSKVPLAMWQIRNKISEMIRLKYKDLRANAEQNCVENFIQKSGYKPVHNKSQLKVLTDLALISEAYGWTKKEHYEIMVNMIASKPKDVFQYQQWLLTLLQLVNL